MTHIHPTLELFATRHTIRAYKRVPLAAGDLDRIVESGQRAPTGGLLQIYSVVRVTDADLRDRLATLCGNQEHIRDAAEFFVFCADLHRARLLLEHRGAEFGAGLRVAVHYATMDALLVAANITAAAEALGYGTCYIGAVLNRLDQVARELELPHGVLPIVGLTIGVPDEDAPPPPKPRLPAELVFHTDTYAEPDSDALDAAYQRMGDPWFDRLSRYLGPGSVFSRREVIWNRTLNQQGLVPNTGDNTDD